MPNNMTHVEVYADIACPWCRLGVARFHRAAGSEEIALVHRPYQLNADAPDEPTPLADAMAGIFGADRAAEMTTEMTRVGAEEGLTYRFDRALAVNTFAAHRLLWFALRDHSAATQATLATALYDAYFQDGRNLADPAQLTAVAANAGLDGDRIGTFLASDEGIADVRRLVAAAGTAGITAVPTFVFPGGERLAGATETAAIGEALRRAREPR